MKARWFPFYPDEWIAGTVGLSAEEEGLYIRACALIYSHGGPVEIALLKRGDHGNRVNACLRRLIDQGKLVNVGGKIDQKRCENELEKAEKRVGKARENGAKGGRPKGLAKPDGFPRGKAKYNHKEEVEAKASPPSTATLSPSPSLRSVEEESSAGAAPAFAVAVAAPEPVDFVKQLWDQGVRLLGGSPSARGLIGKLRREYGDVAVIAALAACEEACPSNPPAYLTACLGRGAINGQHRKLSPADTLRLAFAEAAADCGNGFDTAVALLDSR